MLRYATALRIVPTLPVRSCTRYALSVARDCRSRNSFNCVLGQFFVDGFLEKYYPEERERSEKFDELSKYQPLGRMGEPEEIANLAAFLCSKDASFITGAAYDIDGGVMSLK